MISIGVSEFRTKMNFILQKVQNGEIVTLTSRGTEVARLVPPNIAQTNARQALDQLRETAIIGDVVSPLAESWDAAE